MSTRAMGPATGWSWLARAVNLGRSNPKAVIGAIGLVALVAVLPSILQMVLQPAMGAQPNALLTVAALTTLASLIVFPLLIGGVLRVIDALQLTDQYTVATPGNWRDGDDVIIPLTVQDEEVIKQKYPKGYTAPRPYLRLTPQPNK